MSVINTDNNLDAALLEVENQLQSMKPLALSGELIRNMSERMDAMNEEALTQDEVKELEEGIAMMATPELPEEILDRMVKAMDRWHEGVPVEEKVVSFDGTSPSPKLSEVEVSSQTRFWKYSAAAAVALLGSAAALLIPTNDQGSQVITNNINTVEDGHIVPNVQSNPVIIPPEDAWLVPDSFSHNVMNTKEQGIIFSEDNKAHRLIQLEYVDKVKLLDKNGDEIEVSSPGVTNILLPLETN